VAGIKRISQARLARSSIRAGAPSRRHDEQIELVLLIMLVKNEPMNDVDHIPLSIDFKSSLYWLVSDC
jgi:hypothetical protein